MAKSTFTGSLVGVVGSVLTLLLVRKSGATQKLGTTTGEKDDSFAFELEGSAASSALNAVRSGEADLLLEASTGGESRRIELPNVALPARGRAAPRAVDFGALSAPAAPRDKTTKVARAAPTLIGGGGLGGLGGLGTATPLDANQMLLDLRNRDTQINQLRLDVTNRDNQLNQFRVDLTNRDTQLNQFRVDLNNRDAQLKQLQLELNNRDTQINTLRAQVTANEPTLATLRSQVTALTSARDLALGERAALTKQLTERTGALTDTQNLLKTAQARVDALSADFARSQSELSTRDARVRVLEEQLNAPGRPVPLNSVLEGLGGQVAASADNINKLGGWSLSDVRVQLKMMVTDGGTKVHFPKPGETPATGEVSAVDFLLRPGRTVATATPEVAVPNVVGYSPLIAERKLRALGLGVTTSYQTVKEVAGAPKRAGRVMTQRPAAGGRVAPAGTVELLIGKT